MSHNSVQIPLGLVKIRIGLIVSCNKTTGSGNVIASFWDVSFGESFIDLCWESELAGLFIK